MTLLGVTRVAWSHKGWIAGSVVVLSLLGAGIGSTLHNRTQCRSSLLLDVTDGAEADALFACMSSDVLARAVEACGLEGRLLPAGLAESATVELAGDRLLRLTVERADGTEAERLAAAIAAEAGRSVRVLATRAADRDLAQVRELEEAKRQVQANHTLFQQKLSQLMTEHPFEVGPHGEIISGARRRSMEAQAALTEARREFAEVDAEVAMLRQKLQVRPGGSAGDGGAGAETPAATELRGRIASLDEDIRRLGEDFTDAHPRVARLMAERDRLRAELASPGTAAAPEATDVLAPEIRQQIVAKDGQRSRAASRVASCEAEEKRLAEYVSVHAAAIEDEVRRQSVLLQGTTKELDTAQQQLEAARLAAGRNRASRAAVTVRGGAPPTRVLRSNVTPGIASAAGAAVGLILGSLLAALAEALNPVLRTPEDVRRHVDLPVLATVPAAALRIEQGSRASRLVGGFVWAVVFLAVAGLLLAFVYPGWRSIKELVGRQPAPQADTREVER